MSFGGCLRRWWRLLVLAVVGGVVVFLVVPPGVASSVALYGCEPGGAARAHLAGQPAAGTARRRPLRAEHRRRQPGLPTVNLFVYSAGAGHPRRPAPRLAGRGTGAPPPAGHLDRRLRGGGERRPGVPGVGGHHRECGGPWPAAQPAGARGARARRRHSPAWPPRAVHLVAAVAGGLRRAPLGCAAGATGGGAGRADRHGRAVRQPHAHLREQHTELDPAAARPHRAGRTWPAQSGGAATR